MIAITLCADEIPTCTCTPQINICLPHHWVRLISSAYRGASVSFCDDHLANGCVPAQNNSIACPRTISQALTSVERRSSIASGVVSQTPVTNSTVLRSNSLCTRGFSPISAMTVAASLLRSRVSESTSANSHSTPTVGRGDVAKSIRRLASGLLAGNDTARHPLAGIAGGHRLRVRTLGTVALGVAVRDVGEIVRIGVDHDRGARPCEELRGGERVGGGDQLRRPVGPDLERAEVAARRMGGVTGPLEVSPGGQEVAGRTARRGHRVRLALADRMDVHPVETGSQDAVTDRLDGESRKATGEVEGRRRHRLFFCVAGDQMSSA